MCNLTEYLNRMKDVTGSDNQTALRAGISRQMISKLRHRKCALTAETEVKLARIIELSPAELHRAIAEAMAKTPAERHAWRRSKKVGQDG